MATIKEIAKEAGVSPSTVSIVLGGKAVQRNISEGTQSKVFATAQQMGYRANIAARRLRAHHGSEMTVSVFVAIDKRANMMMRFLHGLQNAATEGGRPFELVIHSYKSGSLHAAAEIISLSASAIICNASVGDIEFLEKTQFPVPIVLLLRDSEKYCGVNVNLSAAGELAAEIFARRGRKNAFILDTEAYYSGMKKCTDAFKRKAESSGLLVTHIREAHSMSGGYSGGIALAKASPLPDCVFSMSDILAIGALRAFVEEDISVPEQVDIISIGVDTPGFEEYAAVPISVLNVPVELLAEECVKLLLAQLAGKPAESVEIPIEFTPRKSCG